MLDRPRGPLLAWAAGLLGLAALLGIAVAAGWGPISSVDDRGNPAPALAAEDSWTRALLRVVEIAFDRPGTSLLTLAVVLYLVLRGYRRAAVFAVAATALAGLVTWVGKLVVSRDRPPWQDPEALLDSGSYPSAHASAIVALAGVVCVLAWMLARRAATRRAAYAVSGLLAVVVCLDRLLLGRHFLSDVVGGALIGAGTVLLVLAVWSPLPRGHAVGAEPLPEAYPSARRLAVVLNPSKVDDVGQFRALVDALAVAAGWREPRWFLTTVEDPGRGMAEAAAVAGADLVLVCGGDGTVREVCAELAGTGIPVGIVPAGTGNLLARNLDIPLYVRAAVDVALNGQDRAIDLVSVSGDRMADSHFLVMAGMGFDAAIMEGVSEGFKARVGWLAYVVSAARSMMYPAVRVDVSVDDGPFSRHRARTVVVGNVGYLQAGMPLLPDAHIDDGRIDVVMLHPESFLSWFPLAYRVLAKRRRVDDTVNRMTGRSVVVRAATDTPRQLDGDPIGPGRELRMTCIPGRLLVRVPR